MRRLPFLFAVALSLPRPGGLAAQAPAQRAALERLRDSLAGVRDSASLKRLETTLIEVAKRHRDDPIIHLQLGFLAYRLGEITARNRHYDDAAGEFEWAGELAPDWPYPWYGLGLAELAQGENPVIAVENIKEQLGKDYLTKAARAFARAVQADPGFAQATIDLAHTALQQRIQPKLDVALQAVRLAAASPAGRDTGVQLARGRLEREVGAVDSALAGFQAYIAAGGDSGLGLLELARSYYLAGRPADGWRAYFAGARVARSPEAVGLYRADLSVVAVPDEVTPFDGVTSPAARAAWLEHFWLRRDVAEARNPGERLAEHYRRWFYAWRNFRLVSRHRHYDITERYRSDQAEFDDRGIIYLRHGPPDERASYPRVVDRLEPNETWLYHRAPPEGDLIFHFVARGDVQDFKLVESLADALTAGQGGALALQSRRGLDALTGELFASRAAINPVYARLGNTVGSANATGALSAERALGRRSIAVGTTTDSYAREFDAPLGTIASDFVVGDSGGQALHVVFAIPARRLAALPDTDRVVYPIAFRLFVSDTADDLVARLDTTRAFTARAPLPDGSYLTGQLRIAVPPGRYRYRLLVRELGAGGAGAGDLVTGDSVVAQLLDGRDFAASDLVLGRRGSGLAWVTPHDTVPLNPLAEFAAGATAALYYELYGLTAGAPYHTVIRLERAGRRSFFHRLFGGKSAPVLLEFDAAAAGPVTRVHRDLDLHDTPTGAYVLTVAIRDPASGATLTRRCRFVVVAR